MARKMAMATSHGGMPQKPASNGKGRAELGEQTKRPAKAGAASRLIDKRIRELKGWRGDILARVRTLIREADPGVIEEWKWEVPVWSHPSVGIICTGEAYKGAVKLTFAKGASIEDPSGLFNAGFGGNTRRAIDIHEGEMVDAAAFTSLVKAAVAQGGSLGTSANAGVSKAKSVTLLSGGNPRIAKGEGDAPVQAYIAAMPGWKRDVGRRLDAIIERAAPGVRKAVKWNSPFYGIDGRGWFLSFHVFTRYVKVAFFRGASLRPMPPGMSKDKNTRYIDIRETDRVDESQFAAWVKQAARLPGWEPKGGAQ